MKKKDIGELNKVYEEADSADKDIFAEFRSNVLLIEGTHYSRKGLRDRPNQRDARDLDYNSQKLRITKNHIHKAVRHYVANILSYAPDITIVPKDETSMQDKKSAELNLAVKQDFDYRYRGQERTRELCEDFVGIGECAEKIFWDPNAGELKGYEHKADENGDPLFEENGSPMADETRPIFSGGFVFERLYGMNLLRHAGAKEMRESECWIVRKMVPVKHLEKLYADDPDKLKFISQSRDDTYVVFDASKTAYSTVKDQTMIREYYYRPCYEYPEGYYYISTPEGVLEEGPLPYGIFPIVWTGFDQYPTTPRGRSIVKVARPFQAEINRASSSMAMHQVTIGDDKILYQSGTKLAPGALLPGVRGLTYQGAAPQILAGRNGGQYLDYINATIQEMESVLMIDEINQEKMSNMDPTALLFRSLKQKAKFGQYGEKFGQYLVDRWELTLKLAKLYLPDDAVIMAVGKSEAINISEFKNTTPLNHQIKIVEMEGTIESQMGKQLMFQHALQYLGSQLSKEQIGMLLKDMPFGNMKDATLELTIDHDIVENDMLSLERGGSPTPTQNVDPIYALKRLDLRMKQPGFELLQPAIQQNYQAFRQQYVDIQTQQAQALIDAKNEFIPANGALIACDMYVPDPSDPQKAAKRVRVPYQALDWLIKTLESQGMGQQALESMNQGTMADIASQIQQQQSPQAMMQPPMGAMQ